MSKRQPSRSAVRLIPPTMASPSRTVTGTSRLTNSKAAVRPAGPAPMTTTCGLSATMLLNLRSRLHLARDVSARGQPAEAGLGCTPILPDTLRLDALPGACVLPTVQIRDVRGSGFPVLGGPLRRARKERLTARTGVGRISSALVQPHLRRALAGALAES